MTEDPFQETAKALVAEFGEEAEQVVVLRADQCARRADAAGEKLWWRVREAVAAILRGDAP